METSDVRSDPSLRLAGVPSYQFQTTACVLLPKHCCWAVEPAVFPFQLIPEKTILTSSCNITHLSLSLKRSVTHAKSHSRSTALTSHGTTSTINTALERGLGWQGVSPSIFVIFTEKQGYKQWIETSNEALLVLKFLEYLSHVTLFFKKSWKLFCNRVHWHSKRISINIQV